MTIPEKQLLRKLPVELMREHIMPFTYQVQSKQLLRDISSFYTDIRLVYDYYIAYDDTPPLLRFRHLFYDLIDFCNGEPPVYSLSNKYINIICRHNYYHKKPTSRIVKHIMCNFHSSSSPMQKIKFLFGLLTPAERTEFINLYIISQE